jgi:hypothetical protein
MNHSSLVCTKFLKLQDIQIACFCTYVQQKEVFYIFKFTLSISSSILHLFLKNSNPPSCEDMIFFPFFFFLISLSLSFSFRRRQNPWHRILNWFVEFILRRRMRNVRIIWRHTDGISHSQSKNFRSSVPLTSLENRISCRCGNDSSCRWFLALNSWCENIMRNQERERNGWKNNGNYILRYFSYFLTKT